MEGWGMKRVLAVSLAMVFVLSALSSGSALAAPKGALQLGLGANQVQGAPMVGLDWKMPTIQAVGMYFPSEWSLLLADISYGIGNEYERTDGSETDKIEVQSAWVDFMGGVSKHFTDGGFLYVALGVTVGWSSLEVSGNDGELTIDAGVGPAFRAGMQLPIKNTFMGYASLTQRCVPTEIKDDDMTMSMNIGGFEMIVGVAWTFGG
jgi:hypothetical protein